MKVVLKVLALMLCVIATSCTDSEETVATVEQVEFQKENFRQRVFALAEEYGVAENISINDSVMQNGVTMSDKEIEKCMKLFAGLKGTYTTVRKEGDTYVLRKKTKRRAGTPEYKPEQWSVSGNDEDVCMDYTLYFGVSASYNDLGHNRVDASMTVEFDIEEYGIIGSHREDVNLRNDVYDFLGYKSFSYCADYDFDTASFQEKNIRDAKIKFSGTVCCSGNEHGVSVTF